MIKPKRAVIAGIYKIISPSGRVYIGQSRHILIRWRDHIRSKAAIGRLFYSFKKYGVAAHLFEIIHELPSDVCGSILTEYEQLYIDLYKQCNASLLNLRDAGSKGKLSEESKIKLSNSLKGKTPWNKGKTGLPPSWNKGKKGVVKFSEESRAKLSASLKGKQNSLGRKMNEKTRIAIAKAKIGSKISYEQKEIIRKKLTGNKHGKENIGKIRSQETKDKISQTLKNKNKNDNS